MVFVSRWNENPIVSNNLPADHATLRQQQVVSKAYLLHDHLFGQAWWSFDTSEFHPERLTMTFVGLVISTQVLALDIGDPRGARQPAAGHVLQQVSGIHRLAMAMDVGPQPFQQRLKPAGT